MADRKPIGGGGAGNPRSLANLRPGAGQWREGDTTNLKAGLRTRRPNRILFDETFHELLESLEATVPLRGPDGAVLPQFVPAIEVACVKLIALRRGLAFLANNGYEHRGRLRPEVEGVNKMAEGLMRDLDRLGATPMSYARLGFDVARTAREQEDVALRWSRQTAEEDIEG